MIAAFLASARLTTAKLILALCGLGLCCPCLAQYWSDSSKEDLLNDIQLQFVPIQMMDDDALIASAEMRRDTRMNASSRLLNSHWLIQNRRNTFTGGSAVNEILKAGFKNFWRSHFGGHAEPQNLYGLQEDKDMTYWGKYAVDLSEEHILVGVRFQF